MTAMEILNMLMLIYMLVEKMFIVSIGKILYII